MGLDMFLYCNSREFTQKVHSTEPYGEYMTDFYRKRGIVLYWRKANAIHKWFVDNVQDGVDDCGTYEVGCDQLKELRDVCESVLDNCLLVDGMVKNGSVWENGKWTDQYEKGKVLSNAQFAHEVLPTQSGFFFGSQDYDQWYYEDVKWTYEQIGAILGMLKTTEESFGTHAVYPDEPDWFVTFYYHSSW